ncbi:TAXI family TRAP transporter solute-binding subunit [Thermodesulfobacteriota bacterium]
MMKRRILQAMLIGASVLVMATAGQARQTIKMATIAPGSSAYLTMTTMATMINQAQNDIQIKVDATGAATKHMIELAQGKIDICMNSPVVYMLMKRGKAMYSKLKDAPELAKNLRLLFWFPYGQYHVVTYAESGIRELKDIRGKKVFLGPPGGGAWNAAREWVEVTTDLKPKKDFDNVKGSWSSAFQGFQDRQFDVYVAGGIAPFPQVEQLALTSKLHILGLTKEEYESNKRAIATTKKPGREVGIIPAGIYGDGVDNKVDVYTLGSVVGVSVNKSMDPDMAYKITKLFWEEAKKNSDTHPWLKSLSKKYAVQNGGMQLHPGAAKYYKEQGVTIPKGSL